MKILNLLSRSNLWLLVLAGSIASNGCGGFHRQWTQSLQQPAANGAVTGPWDGQWLSHVNGHQGRLRCVITEKDGDGYEAFFQAKYYKILTFSYKVDLRVDAMDQGWTFEGEEDLGWYAGGLYEYLGTVNASGLSATYTNKYDHGVFEMSRPETE